MSGLDRASKSFLGVEFTHREMKRAIVSMLQGVNARSCTKATFAAKVAGHLKVRLNSKERDELHHALNLALNDLLERKIVSLTLAEKPGARLKVKLIQRDVTAEEIGD